MKNKSRFQDQNLRLSDFYREVAVVCPACAKKAIAKVVYEQKRARLYCIQCGYNKETTTEVVVTGLQTSVQMAANAYFDAELWYKLPFKNELFYAYNKKHLIYLEQYIFATLREHKDRTHFTLLEKLPKFYHEAKNREALLKIIEKLKKKITGS